MRALGLLAVAVLGAAAAFLVACGDRSALIPERSADRLEASLDRVRSAVDDGDCQAAANAVTQARGALVTLPDAVDPDLRARLREGIDNLARRAGVQCARQTPTTQTQETQETQETQTTTEPTTPTTPTETTTTPTDTEPTETTTTDTQPTEPAPTEPEPEEGTGGVTPGDEGDGR